MVPLYMPAAGSGQHSTLMWTRERAIFSDGMVDLRITHRRKRRIALVALFMAAAAMVTAAQGHVVEGTINGIEGDGTLYVAIFDRTGWDAAPDFREGFVRGTTYEVDTDEVKSSQEVSYRFEDIPTGTYAIRAFLDENGNEDLDFGMLGPKEPWGVYQASGPILGPPRFTNLSFEVDGHISNAHFEMR